MKRRLLGILLSFALMLTMMPALGLPAYADDAEAIPSEAGSAAAEEETLTNDVHTMTEDYPLWVGGRRVTSANKDDVFGDGKVSYTPASGDTPAKLKLENYSYEGTGHMDEYNSYSVYSEENLTIELTGSNTITNTTSEMESFAICLRNSQKLNITGSGTLTANSSNTISDISRGIYADQITIGDNATVKANGGNSSYEDGSSEGVLASGLTVKGTLEAKGDLKTQNSYGVRLKNGGTSVEVKSGSTVTAVGNTRAIEGNVKNAIAGTGWENADGSGEKTDIAVDTSDEGQSLIFKKVQFPPMFTVTFDANGHGTAPDSQTVATGNKATKPEDPTAQSYTFGGWYKEAACETQWDFDNDTVTADTTLYAKWTEKPEPTPPTPTPTPTPTPASNPLAVTTTAKTSARSMTVKWTWDNVPGAKSYKVSYHKVGSKKWTTKKTKKTKYVVKGHKMKGLYEYKVAAVTASGDVWSNTSCRYFKGVKTKANAGKAAGTVRASWKKDKGATGYQVKLATNKKLNGAQVVNVSADKKSYTFSGLKSGKKYYVSVRPLKDHNGVTYKGIQCKALKVKTK